MKLSAFVLFCFQGRRDRQIFSTGFLGFVAALLDFENDTTNPAQNVFNYVVSDEFSIAPKKNRWNFKKGQPTNGRRKDEILRLKLPTMTQIIYSDRASQLSSLRNHFIAKLSKWDLFELHTSDVENTTKYDSKPSFCIPFCFLNSHRGTTHH